MWSLLLTLGLSPWIRLLTNDGLRKDHLVLSLNPGLLGVRGVITCTKRYQDVLSNLGDRVSKIECLSSLHRLMILGDPRLSAFCIYTVYYTGFTVFVENLYKSQYRWMWANTNTSTNTGTQHGEQTQIHCCRDSSRGACEQIRLWRHHSSSLLSWGPASPGSISPHFQMGPQITLVTLLVFKCLVTSPVLRDSFSRFIIFSCQVKQSRSRLLHFLISQVLRAIIILNNDSQ